MAKPTSKELQANVKMVNALFIEIKSQIDLSRKGLAIAVNQTLTVLYWNISALIHDHVLKGNRAEYGKEIFATLSQKLTDEYGQGYSSSALTRMLKFYRLFSDRKIVATLC